MSSSSDASRLIKKYSNRRLYDTHTSNHVTLNDIREMVAEQIPFHVVEVSSGEDITRTILLQIIQEAENDGEPILSSDMLKSIIRAYGPLQGLFTNYLENSIQTMLDVQKQTGSQSSEAWSVFLQSQMPAMQNMMNQYLEQSKQLYLNTQNMFGLFNAFNASASPKKDS